MSNDSLLTSMWFVSDDMYGDVKGEVGDSWYLLSTYSVITGQHWSYQVKHLQDMKGWNFFGPDQEETFKDKVKQLLRRGNE